MQCGIAPDRSVLGSCQLSRFPLETDHSWTPAPGVQIALRTSETRLQQQSDGDHRFILPWCPPGSEFGPFTSPRVEDGVPLHQATKYAYWSFLVKRFQNCQKCQKVKGKKKTFWGSWALGPVQAQGQFRNTPLPIAIYTYINKREGDTLPSFTLYNVLVQNPGVGDCTGLPSPTEGYTYCIDKSVTRKLLRSSTIHSVTARAGGHLERFFFSFAQTCLSSLSKMHLPT